MYAGIEMRCAVRSDGERVTAAGEEDRVDGVGAQEAGGVWSDDARVR